MGEGQEIQADLFIRTCFVSGGWVILQNCHLGLVYMNLLEGMLSNKSIDIDEGFRLWITCEPTDRFPIGLLQMSIKVANEPPKGIQAGLHRTYTTTINQDTLDRIEPGTEKWRMLV